MEITEVSQLEKLIKLKSEAYKLESAQELAIFACNSPHQLHRYFQSVSWHRNKLNKIEVTAVSGVSMVEKNAPIVRFIVKLIKVALSFENKDKALLFTPDAIKNKDLKKEWDGFLPPYCQWLPYTKNGHTEAGLLIFHEQPVTTDCHKLFVPLSRTFEHIWYSFPENRKKQFGLIARFTRSSIQKILIFLMVAGILCIPVRESALAPSSVVATKPIIVSSSISGVIRDIHVPPNEFVNKGDLLVSLDSDQLVSDLEIARKELTSANTELLIASQRSFNQDDARAEVNLLQSKAESAELNVQRAQSLLNRSKIYAEEAGLAIYTDKYEFLGQSVTVGQRIMLLADINAVEIDIYMPVGDTIDFEVGDEVLLFLNTDPTKPIKAKLRQTSFEPRSRENGDYVFQLKAQFDSKEYKGRIGWAGTAKVYSSSKVSLFMYFFRRPISTVRRFFGL